MTAPASSERQKIFSHRISRLITVAQQGNVRASCWLTGASEWTKEVARQVLEGQGKVSGYVIISSRQWSGLQTCPVHQTHRLLGREVDLLIYDGFSGINPDTLGQISGLLKGGGLFLFLTPAPFTPAFFDDPEKQRLLVEPYTCSDVGNHFLEHLRRCFITESAMFRFDQERGFSSMHSKQSATPSLASMSLALDDQQQVINKVHRHLQASGQQCCVLTAARGRGKSSALGIIARLLMKEGESIVVTAPRADAVESLFQHAASEEGVERTRYQVLNKSACLTFHLPVDVCSEGNTAAILLVDEAAGIPVHLLTRYLDKFPKIIFATTTQGYEGTGQGFAIRFLPTLRQRVSSLACYTLEKPVRWSESDSLEPFFNRLLILDAVAPVRMEVGSNLEKIHYRVVDPEGLVSHPQLLRDLFGLMIDAHYRTTPGDLRIMLDSPNLKIWIAEAAGQVVGACLVAEEGGLDDELLQRIWEGRRRPRGHLIPQLLIAQEGYLEAAEFTALRIVRIAVHDQYRRRKVASGLIEAIHSKAAHQETLCYEDKRQTCDLIGASFAVTPVLLSFWQQQGFQVIRIGTQLDPVSGAYAALVLKGVSVRAKQKLPLWQSEFQRRFDYLKREWLTGLPTDIVQRIEFSSEALLRAEQDDWRDLSGFAFHFRSYESSAFLFAELAKRYRTLWDQNTTNERIRYLIEIRVIQQQSEDEVMQHYQWTQRKTLLASLRSAAAFLYEQAQLAGLVR